MKEVVFIADMFASDYRGGAELTSQALIDSCPKQYDIKMLHTRSVTENFILDNKDAHWVVFNFARLSSDMKLAICKNVKYSIVEYDYKFCKYRSLEGHILREGRECSCAKEKEGKINLAFYGLASRVWFMSEVQRSTFLEHVPTLKKENTKVLNSVFSEGDLRFIDSIKNNKKDEKYLIVKSNSWVKGFEECVRYAKENNLDYEIVTGLPYHEMLIRLSTAKGLIFLPVGADTCPRLVMEAQMLGCELRLNNLVQHKDEKWASSADMCREHMGSRTKEFWSFYEQD